MATYPNTESASDIWSLRDVYKAEAGDEWPSGFDPYTLQPFDDASCVRFYTFDQSTEDLIGNDTSASISGSLQYTTGKVGSALSGSASAGHIDIASYSGGTSGSYSFWIYVPSTISENLTWTVLSDSNTGNNVVLRSVSNGFIVRQSNGNESSAQPYDQWIHVVFIRTGATTATVYFNGGSPENLTGARTDSDPYIRIGSDQVAINDYVLDHLRFFNKQLTAQEVSDLYNIDNG